MISTTTVGVSMYQAAANSEVMPSALTYSATARAKSSTSSVKTAALFVPVSLVKMSELSSLAMIRQRILAGRRATSRVSYF